MDRRWHSLVIVNQQHHRMAFSQQRLLVANHRPPTSLFRSSQQQPQQVSHYSQLRIISVPFHPQHHHNTLSSSSSSWHQHPFNYSYYYYYHTSRPWRRLDHRHRQHLEEQQIQKCAQRIMTMLEPSSSSASVGGEAASTTTSTTTAAAAAAASETTTTALSSPSSSEQHHNNNNMNTVTQFVRHLSPHARFEIDRTLTKMATHHHKHHHHQHHAQHHAPHQPSSTTTPSTTATTTNATTTTSSSSSSNTPAAAAATTTPTASSSSTSSSSSSSDTIIPEPPLSQLRLLAYQQAIPFVGFGIMDNAILIIAGDAIDTWLGVSFGISTMCAAAIGNIVSDVAGVMLGTVVEDLCARLGLPVPHLSEAQRTLRSVRFAGQTGICIGLVVGCIIGMFPLLFIDTTKTLRLKRQAKLQELVQDVVEEAKTLVQAERTTLFLRVASEESHLSPTGDGPYLYAKYHTQHHDNTRHVLLLEGEDREVDGNKRSTRSTSDDGVVTIVTEESDIQSNNTSKQHGDTKGADSATNTTTTKTTTTSQLIPLGRGIVSRSALTGQALNLYHVQSEPDFDPDTFDLHHVTVKNMLCVPVLDEQGRAIAVIQAINKQKKKKNKNTTTSTTITTVSTTEKQQERETSPKENMPQGFTSNDVQILKALASHISIALRSLSKDDADVTMRDTIRTLKEHGTGILEQNQNPIRSRPLFPADEAGLKEN